MTIRMRQFLAGVWLATLASAPAAALKDPPLPAQVEFNRDIRPIFSDTCFKCHGFDANTRKARLRLDLPEGALASRKGGAAIVAGKPSESLAWKRLTSTDPDEKMPPPESGMQLTPRQLQLIERWIQQGARYQQHWSFIPPVAPALPKVRKGSWPRNPVDHFVLARLEQAGLSPSPEADKQHLLRRVTLDLTGLPPTPAEMDAFLSDESRDAYEKVVNRLLDTPAYGERMALEWLDAARFADTHGYHLDSGRDMTRWRGYVIDSFNKNKPFDQFTVEQLAGDLLPEATLEQRIATGFNRNHMINYEGGAIPEEYHAAYVMDRVNTTSTVWLGLTVACAQCHDHKYDPITQKEFFQLYAFFNNVPESGLDGSQGNAAPVLPIPTPEQREQLEELEETLRRLEARRRELEAGLPERVTAWASALSAEARQALPEKVRAAIEIPAPDRTSDQAQALVNHYREKVESELRPLEVRIKSNQKAREELVKRIPTTMVMQEMAKPRETFLLVRGQYDKKGERVTPGVPASLHPFPKEAPLNRLGLAQWIVSPENPLTARVTVNRYWQMYFGTGLVKTSEDFGSQAEWPSHPELLDWLAAEFVRSGWDVKRLQKLLVMSATYRQSSVISPKLASIDPENRLLARGPRLRLQAEFIRDQALAVSGLLQREIGGRSVSFYQPAGLWEELSQREDSKRFSAQFFEQSHGPDLYRRTLYTFWKRTSPPPALYTFDAPDREICTVRRPRTNTPLQALVLMNDPTFVEAARKLAERLMREAGTDAARAELGFRLVTGRKPRPAEVRVLLGLLKEQQRAYAARGEDAGRLLQVGEAGADPALNPRDLASWTVVANTLLNLDETITKN